MARKPLIAPMLLVLAIACWAPLALGAAPTRVLLQTPPLQDSPLPALPPQAEPVEPMIPAINEQPLVPTQSDDPFAVPSTTGDGSGNGTITSGISALPEPMVIAAATPDTQQPGFDPTQGGPVRPEELPADVALLLTEPTSGSSSAGGSAAQARTGGGRPAKPPPVIGTLTSLLDPPPGFVPPPLSEQQLANIPLLKKMRQGLATVTYMRAVSNYDGTNMNCGMGYLNDYFKDHFVGIPRSMYRSGELCGVCIKTFCVDSICKDPLQTNTTYMVTDSCDECKGNDIVVAPRGTAAMSGVDYNNNPSIQVAWEFTSCSTLIEGGIKLLPSDDNAEDFVGLNFSNLKVLLKGVRINGLPMERTQYGMWAIRRPGEKIPLRPPYALELVGVNNQRLALCKYIATMTVFDEAIRLIGKVKSSQGTLQTQEFLDVCRQVLPIVEKLGTGFSLVKMDVGGNIDRLATRAATKPDVYNADIFQMVRDEVEEGTNTESTSCTKGLLWLKRAMQFIVALLQRLDQDRGVSLSQAASETYYSTLQQYHGWIVTGTFTVALKLVPSRDTFFHNVGAASPEDEGVLASMREFCGKFGAELGEVHKFLDEAGLDDPAKV